MALDNITSINGETKTVIKTVPKTNVNACVENASRFKIVFNMPAILTLMFPNVNSRKLIANSTTIIGMTPIFQV